MRIRWTPAAAADLIQINDYLTERLRDLAETTILRLCGSIQSLKNMPMRGRPGRVTETRELVLPRLPYIVVYRIRGEAIEILHVHHGAQNWK